MTIGFLDVRTGWRDIHSLIILRVSAKFKRKRKYTKKPHCQYMATAVLFFSFEFTRAAQEVFAVIQLGADNHLAEERLQRIAYFTSGFETKLD